MEERSDLFKLKIMEFYKKKGNPERDAEEFYSFIIEKLNNLKSPLRIMTNSYNVGDGIGDYNNQLDFNLWLEEIFNGFENVKITSNSFFGKSKEGSLAKEEIALKITPENMRSRIVFIEKKDDFENITFDSDKMYFIRPAAQRDFGKIPEPNIKNNLKQIDFFLNLATPLNNKYGETRLLYENLPSGCLIHSRTEYGVNREKGGFYGSRLCNETPMGVGPDEKGIKFYPSLENLCKETNTLEKKVELIESIDNQAMKKAVGKTDKRDFILSHGFAFGYLQEQKYSREFVLTMCAMFGDDKKDGAVFIINLNHFKDIEDSISFLEQLKSDGFSQIEMIDSDGNSKTIPLSKENTGKCLTLINFGGMSNEDKNKIMALSDAVGGSGNTSFSEMISSGKLPFLQPIEHCHYFYLKFRILLEKYNNADRDANRILNDKLLHKYWELIYGPLSNEKVENLRQLVSSKENVERIMEAWTRYCSFLKDNKNVYDDFVEMIVSAIVMKEFEFTSDKELDELLDWFPAGKLADISFFHMAIEKGLDIDKKKYLLDFYDKHDLKLTSKIGSKTYTPLGLAHRYDDNELFQDILQRESLIDKIKSVLSERCTDAEQGIENESELELIQEAMDSKKTALPAGQTSTKKPEGVQSFLFTNPKVNIINNDDNEKTKGNHPK